MADTTGSTATTVGDTGGNTATGSGGTVQVGGDNTATQSLGTVQVSQTSSSSTVQAQTSTATVTATAPATIGGSGTNISDGSVLSVQVGGGNTARGATGALQIQRTRAGLGAKATAGRLAPAAAADVQVSGEGLLGELLGVDLSSLGSIPGPAALLVLDLVHSLLPDVTLSTAVGELASTGTIRLTGNGDDVRIDLGSVTIQVVSLVRHPSLELAILGTDMRLGALVGVPDPVESTATDSPATVQAGDGNTATDSVGTARIGSLVLAPELDLTSSELGTTASLGGGSGVEGGDNSADGSIGTIQVSSLYLAPTFDASAAGIGAVSTGGTSGIAGDGNSADGSIGTVQIGGGNSADGSAGAAQAGSTTLAPSAAATITPLDTTIGIGGSSGTGGGGNLADGSIGAVQIGGGNTSDGSIATAQSRSVDTAPTASAGDTTLTPAVDLGGFGSGAGNIATDSIGVAQVGVSNSSDQSIGVVQIGPLTVGQAPGGPGGGGTPGGPGGRATPVGPSRFQAPPTTGTPGTAGVTTPPASSAPRAAKPAALSRPGAVLPAATGRPAQVTPPAAPPANASGKLPVLGAKLPFTGLSLWLVALLAIGLLAAGGALRRVAPRRVRV